MTPHNTPERKGSRPAWRRRLRREIEAARAIVILGVGNPRRGDDAAGIACARRLQKHLRASESPFILLGFETPENLTGKIRGLSPDLVVIIDAAAIHRKPGAVALVEKERMADDGISTHHISLRYLVTYLEESAGCRAVVVGIQPEACGEGGRLSRPVARAVRTVCDVLAAAWAARTRAPGRSASAGNARSSSA